MVPTSPAPALTMTTNPLPEAARIIVGAGAVRMLGGDPAASGDDAGSGRPGGDPLPPLLVSTRSLPFFALIFPHLFRGGNILL